jgi:hypothetical protein
VALEHVAAHMCPGQSQQVAFLVMRVLEEHVRPVTMFTKAYWRLESLRA